MTVDRVRLWAVVGLTLIALGALIVAVAVVRDLEIRDGLGSAAAPSLRYGLPSNAREWHSGRTRIGHKVSARGLTGSVQASTHASRRCQPHP